MAFSTGCKDDGKAQESQMEFSASFSGSFITQSVKTDTDGDGRPASLGTLEGNSSLGRINIQNLIEFAQLPEPVTCPEDKIEFRFVRGNFVIRIEESGDLLFGEWTSGTSCFDRIARIANRTQEGTFTGGTGQFSNINGPVQLSATPMLLTTTEEQGYAFAANTGDLSGTIIFGGQ